VTTAGAAVLLAAGLVTTNAAAASSTTTTLRPVFHGAHSLSTFAATSGTSATRTATARSNINAGPEFPRGDAGNEESAPQGGATVQDGTVTAPTARSVPVTQNPAGVQSSFQGSNHFDSRYSGGGNQFSGEPPDQGMCVGNNKVFEIVNSVVQVFTKSGTPLIAGNKAFPDGPSVGLTLNEFYGLPPSIDRTSGAFGPFMFDTQCLYDSSANRWFVSTANLDQDPTTGEYTGEGQTWIAVSTSANPLGGWNIWSIDTTNNGTNGTPDHQCDLGYCFGDYPHIGLDANGLYLTTDEFSMFGSGYYGAQIYAISKAGLVAGKAAPTMQMFQNVPTSTYNDMSYAVEPVNGLPGDWARGNNGTMYFGMSGSPFTTGLARSIVLYSLTNTGSLNSMSPALRLRETSVKTQPYAVPGYAQQANGPMPLLKCINDPACIGATYPKLQRPMVLDAGNSGMVLGEWLHAGQVYLTAGTPLTGRGAATYDETDGSWQPIQQRTGVAWFVLNPCAKKGSFTASLARNGYLAVKGANLTFPSIVVGPSGAGAISATLVGPRFYPSAAVARFAPGQAPSSVQLTGLGVGPNDGFTATGAGGYRPRWGDYGAATVEPNGTMWVASEYTPNRCTNREFNTDPTCGYTRSFYANWSTHITGIAPLN